MSAVLGSLRMRHVFRVKLGDDVHQGMHDLCVDVERLILVPLQDKRSRMGVISVDSIGIRWMCSARVR